MRDVTSFREVKCNACGAIVSRNEVHDNGHTIWTEDEGNAYPNTCGPVEDGEYRNQDCIKCGRHRVQSDGVCEKCLWDNDAGNYASITRPDKDDTQGQVFVRGDENSIL